MRDKPALQRILEGTVHTEEKNKHSEEAAEKVLSDGGIAVMQSRTKKANTTNQQQDSNEQTPLKKNADC